MRILYIFESETCVYLAVICKFGGQRSAKIK
jgi:hypothetical protein